jgi:hypothetical protein
MSDGSTHFTVAIDRCTWNRNPPLGDPLWTLDGAHRLRLDYILRPRGRPSVRLKNE